MRDRGAGDRRDRRRGVEVEAHGRDPTAPRRAARGRPRSSTSRRTRARALVREGRGRSRPRRRGARRRRDGLVGRHAPGDERRALLGDDDVLLRPRPGAARKPLGHGRSALEAPTAAPRRARRAARRARVRRQVRVEACGTVAAARTRRPARSAAARGSSGRADAERVRVGDDERARPLRAAEPLLPGDRVEVEPARVDRDRPDRLRAVDEDRAVPCGALRSCTGSTAPVVQRTCESASRRVRGVTAATMRSGSGSTTTTRAPGRVQRADEPEVLVRRRDDLVVRPEVEPGEHDVAAVGRRRRERDLLRLDTPTSAASSPRSSSRSSRMRSNRAALPRALGERRLLVGGHRVERRRARAARRCPPAGRRSARAPGTARVPRSNVTRGILPTPGLTFRAMRVVIADPPAYTPSVRPLARGGARSRRGRRRARHVALPLRRRRATRRVRRPRVVLPALRRGCARRGCVSR